MTNIPTQPLSLHGRHNRRTCMALHVLHVLHQVHPDVNNSAQEPRPRAPGPPPPSWTSPGSPGTPTTGTLRHRTRTPAWLLAHLARTSERRQANGQEPKGVLTCYNNPKTGSGACLSLDCTGCTHGCTDAEAGWFPFVQHGAMQGLVVDMVVDVVGVSACVRMNEERIKMVLDPKTRTHAILKRGCQNGEGAPAAERFTMVDGWVIGWMMAGCAWS